MVSTSLIIATVVTMILYIVGGRLYRFYLFRKRVNKIPGPVHTIPFFGLMYDIMMKPKKDRLEWFLGMADQYKDGFFRTWIGSTANAHIHKPEHIEPWQVLRLEKPPPNYLESDRINDRSFSDKNTSAKTTVKTTLSVSVPAAYEQLPGAQWVHDRKLLTPAFHFSILDNFSEVMIDKAVILNSCIEREMKIRGDKPFDIFELGAKCTLDIICETAMGTNINAQEATDCEYIRTIAAITGGAMNRYLRPWLNADWIFYRTALGKSFKAAVDTAQDLCTSVIVRKKKKRKLGVAVSDVSADNEVMGKRKWKAFLDLLLEANEKEENPLTMEEIRDQINTFMFAGHDTTAALFSWTLFCLGNELDVQRKVHKELDDILGDSADPMTLKKLPNLTYLERVIKEVLRLYPSVTSISRKMVEDMQIGDYVIPAGAFLSIHIYRLHRDPAIWPDPLRFDPDRFLPENVKTRHPYAYVPFSAGPRNCIGKKFAMLETKVLLAQILRNFSVKSIEKHSTMKKYADIILRPADGIYVSMTKRAVEVEKRN